MSCNEEIRMLAREIAVDYARTITALVDIGMLIRRSGIASKGEVERAITASEALAAKLNDLLTRLDGL